MLTGLLHHLKHYWNFYRSATTIFQAHSPLVYHFAKEVVEFRPPKALFSKIEKQRNNLLKDHTSVQFVELGAGSKYPHTAKAIKQIAGSSLSRPLQCKQIYNIVNTYKPATVLEMGTSLGIATAYIAEAGPDIDIRTLEGDPTVRQYAQGLFDSLGYTQITIHEGDFADTLPSVLDELPSIDLAFVDGNHSYEPTLDYFEQLVKRSHKDTILIFDDIYWSQGMVDAWSTIKKHPTVRCTVDLYHMGIVWLHPDGQPPVHTKLVRYRHKPWRVGLFG